MPIFIKELISELASCVSVRRVTPWWMPQIKLYHLLLLSTWCDGHFLRRLLMLDEVERALLGSSRLGERCLLRVLLRGVRGRCRDILLRQSGLSMLHVLRLILAVGGLGGFIVLLVIDLSELSQRHVLLQYLRVIDPLNLLYPMIWRLVSFW